MRGLPLCASLAQRLQIGLMDRIYGGEPKNQARTIQLPHPVARHLIFHRPQACDQRPHSRYLKGAPQAQYTLPGLHFTNAGIACGENCPLHSAQIQRGNFFGGKDAVLFVGSCRLAVIRARKRQSRKQQRVFAYQRDRRFPFRILAGFQRGSTLAPKEETMRRQMQDALRTFGPAFSRC